MCITPENGCMQLQKIWSDISPKTLYILLRALFKFYNKQVVGLTTNPPYDCFAVDKTALPRDQSQPQTKLARNSAKPSKESSSKNIHVRPSPSSSSCARFRFLVLLHACSEPHHIIISFIEFCTKCIYIWCEARRGPTASLCGPPSAALSLQTYTAACNTTKFYQKAHQILIIILVLGFVLVHFLFEILRQH